MADVAPTILTYPEVIFGANPLNTAGGDPTDTAHVFPVVVSDLRGLTAAYDISFGGYVGGFNVAYDIWLSNSATATGRSAVSNEVMVWLHKGSFDEVGAVVGTYSKGDLSAKIYHSGTYTAIVAEHDLPARTIDIADIFAKLGSLGILSSTEYLRSVELGAEVVSGSGYLTVNDLSLQVTKAKVSGGTTLDTVTGAGTNVIDVAAPFL